MDQVTLLTSLTRATPCPECRETRLEFLYRCDLQYGACLYTAHCRACEMSFEIVTGADPATLEGIPDVVEPCPHCGTRQRKIRLHCELESRRCVVVLACAFCHTERAVKR